MLKRNSSVRNLVGIVLHLFLPTLYRLNDRDLFVLPKNLFTRTAECPTLCYTAQGCSEAGWDSEDNCTKSEGHREAVSFANVIVSKLKNDA